MATLLFWKTFMKNSTLQSCLLVGAVLSGFSLSLPAIAQSHGGGRGGTGGASGFHAGGGRASMNRGRGGGWQRGGPGWWGVGLGLGLGWGGAYLGDPYAWSPGYYAQYDTPPLVDQAPVQPMPPAGYATRSNSSATPNWYYCESAKGYYPYVSQCPEAWRVVPAAPPGAGQ
jgi:hypothetical protein